MDIDFQEFLHLPSYEKCTIIWNEGVFVAGRMKNELAYNLYVVFDVYAEICFNLGKNTVEGVELSCTTDLLDPYCDEIVLPSF